MATKIKKPREEKYVVVDGVVFKVDLVKTPATGDLFLEERSEDEGEDEQTDPGVAPEPAPEPPLAPAPEPVPEPALVPGGVKVHRHRKAYTPEQYERMKAEGKPVNGSVSIAEDVGAVGREVVSRQVPSADSTPEKKREAQKKRSEKYGIEVLESGANLSYPSGDPTTENLYGDPVNLKYPLGYEDNKVSLARSNNARARFKGNADTYTEEASKKIVHTRIVEAQIKAGATPSYNPDDSLDKLLPSDLVNKMEGSTVEREETGMEELLKKFDEAVGVLKTAAEGLSRSSKPASPPKEAPEAGKAETPPATEVKPDPVATPAKAEASSPVTPPVATGEPDKKPEGVATPEKPSPATEPATSQAGENQGHELKEVVSRMADVVQGLAKTVTDVASKVDTMVTRVTEVERAIATPNSSSQDGTDQPEKVERSKNIWAGLL